MMHKPFAILLVLLLGGCFGGGAPVPQDQFYRLTEVSDKVARATPLVDVLAVASLQSDDLLRERAILYSEADEPLSLQRYHYHFWTQAPGQMVQEQLIDYLRVAGIARQVVRFGEVAQVDAHIDGYLKRFERRVGKGSPQVFVSMELMYRQRSGQRKQYVWEYAVQETATDQSMHATVAAFSTALQKIYQTFLNDLKATAH